MTLSLRPFAPADTEELVKLWELCGLTVPWNNPRRDIERKLLVQSELFIVGLDGGRIVASVMGGYDGHRGWLYYLAVHPEFRHRGYGRAIINDIEERLQHMGCPKINLQVRTSNHGVMEFYRKLGYGVDEVAGLGRRLVED